MSETLSARVCNILANQSLRAPQSVTPNTLVADLSLDSLALVEALFALESAFDISIPFDPEGPNRFADLTVQGVIDLVQSLQSKG